MDRESMAKYYTDTNMNTWIPKPSLRRGVAGIWHVTGSDTRKGSWQDDTQTMQEWIDTSTQWPESDGEDTQSHEDDSDEEPDEHSQTHTNTNTEDGHHHLCWRDILQECHPCGSSCAGQHTHIGGGGGGGGQRLTYASTRNAFQSSAQHGGAHSRHTGDDCYHGELADLPASKAEVESHTQGGTNSCSTRRRKLMPFDGEDVEDFFDLDADIVHPPKPPRRCGGA